MNINVLIFVGVILLIAMIQDLRTGKISNELNLVLVVVGLLYNALLGGLNSTLHSLMGIMIPVIGLIALFYKGIIGAGDIKLLSGLGAIIGTDVIWVMVYSFVACGMFGIVVVLIKLVKCLKTRNIRGILKLTKVAFSVFILIGFWWQVLGGI